MSQIFNLSSEEMIQHIKLSFQIPDVLEAIASQKIITETALAAGIVVESEELQAEGDSWRLANSLVTAQETWSWLEKHYLSLEEFEEVTERKILARKLANHLFAEQVERFFYENQFNYAAAVTYEVVLENRDSALELCYAVQEGEVSFPEIAREYIVDPELRSALGYQGKRHRQDFRPEIAAAVFAANPPQILKPITTPKGVYLIWVEEIIQPELDEELRLQIQEELFANWLKEKIEKIEIAITFDSGSNFQVAKELVEA